MNKLTPQERELVDGFRKREFGRKGWEWVRCEDMDGILKLIDRLAQEPDCSGCIHADSIEDYPCSDCRRVHTTDHYERKEATHGE